ncbi:murein biosynthesis integral membrane protein MurJ [Oceanivirga miroungae]|uniref:Probable lipid II flippase MurJ n=1 Tax=Oceanivirga miroungae TaxID=1130046 RepID=A0A6I8MDE1_9FUSO|nr:murein biosynthesis integral membrane protein MurJ [Oceanivirga miroungae]VWL85471.1 integral membrane protein MviN [Oceanivirga miroungae]
MFKKSFMVSFINMVSRVLGLIREVLMATFFGSNSLTDAYFASTKIANFFTTLLSDGSMGTVLIPLYLEKDNKKNANNFINSILLLLFNFSLVIALIIFFGSEYILKYLIGFTNIDLLEKASFMLKIMSFYIVFIALSAVVSAYLNAHKLFLVSSLVGISFNITIISGIILAKKTMNIYVLAASFLISGLVQLLIQVPKFLSLIKNTNFKIDLKDKAVKEFFVLMLPTIIGIFAYQVNEIVDTNFAARLEGGTISAINYASRLYLLPVGIFAVSFSTVIYTHITEAIIKKEIKKANNMFNIGMNMISFFMIPCTFGLFFYGEDIIKLIFNYGAFNMQNVKMTAEILMIYSLGLIFFGQNHMLIRVHYANKNRLIPVISSFIAIAINILLDYYLYLPYKHIGLTIATVISAAINYLILLVSVKLNYIDFNIKKQLIFITKILVFSTICLYISSKFNLVIIKVIVFMIIYAILWAYPFYKKRRKMFD